MKVLFINYSDAGNLKLLDISDISSDNVQQHLDQVNQGEGDLVQIDKDSQGLPLLRQAIISSEDVPDNEDDENSDTHEEFSIDDWQLIT